MQSCKSAVLKYTDDDKEDRVRDASALDLYALGLTIVIGGQYFGWNKGLFAGFGSMVVGMFLMAIAYLCLCLCMSELTSAIPFAGGSYGLARCTLGNYLGFVIGCSECLEYIIYVAAATVSLGDMFVVINNNIDGYQWVVWIGFFISSVLIHVFGCEYFWRFNLFLAAVSVVILLIFVVASFQYVDFTKNASGDNAHLFEGGMQSFMKAFPLNGWFYVGVESINFAAKDTADPKKQIPLAQTMCICTLIVTSILVMFVSCSLPPGVQDLSHNLSALNPGFDLAFKLENSASMILSIPATYATAYGFQYSYGNIMVAMADSNLLPSFLHYRYNNKSYPSLIVGSIIGAVVCVLMHFVPIIKRQMFNICILFAFFCYAAQCIGYIHMKLRFPALQRQFQSPVGIAGAAFAVVVWVLGIISVIFFQADDGFAVFVVIGIIVLESIYYLVEARYQQTLSADEKAMMFFAKEREFLSVYHSIRSCKYMCDLCWILFLIRCCLVAIISQMASFELFMPDNFGIEAVEKRPKKNTATKHTATKRGGEIDSAISPARLIKPPVYLQAPQLQSTDGKLAVDTKKSILAEPTETA
jgi:ethanolamine permease